jgi:hypothetical protein
MSVDQRRFAEPLGKSFLVWAEPQERHHQPHCLNGLPTTSPSSEFAQLAVPFRASVSGVVCFQGEKASNVAPTAGAAGWGRYRRKAIPREGLALLIFAMRHSDILANMPYGAADGRNHPEPSGADS